MNGIIPLYKPRGVTSADCVYQLRKILHEKKIGHTGTLDPEVDGVLVICVGQATKLVNRLMISHKVYQGQILLGQETTTEDATGEVVKQKPVDKPYSDQQISTAMLELTGNIKQQPPMFSAVKINGKKLYEYARAGQSVERPIRDVEIYQFKQTESTIFDEQLHQQTIAFEVECSKGTYIRTLAVQLGQLLQVPAHMKQLTRTKGSHFALAQTFTLEQIQAQFAHGQTDFLISLTNLLKPLVSVDLTVNQWQVVQNGGRLKLAQNASEIILRYQGIVKAIYRHQQDFYEPELMLLKNDL
ncbi:tRNA pseudouridine(55) synthase TruB [Bombilactobacillus thymidiniphilus]|uniref:tRNA pseudouridine synthase B n=1 Tax=Bombilactobacillus thymidiniphilus TaxID=2923363 RepID=A0ABY4PD50_9LACO|nr:tRNA pseudouridine(55) synthase TruB [Bombilactobacillus thymidiniphilus]UQS83505.1 tRNA pseudouridine(55) synthase TruB [Bombilactobacillus thymidiniphilus]